MSAVPPPPRPGARALPWMALALPPLAWVLFQWGLGSALRPACGAVGSWLGPAWGAASLAACALGFALGRRVATDPSAIPVRPWIAKVAMIGAGVFALAITLQLIAVLLVPACVR